jgi:hypothetical protein
MGKKKQAAKSTTEESQPKPSRWRENIKNEIDETVKKTDERLKRQREKDEQ